MSAAPPGARLVLERYFALLNSRLPDLLDAFYLHGSACLGAFRPGLSDVDFLAVARAEITPEQLSILREIHRSLQRKYPRTILDGLYALRADLMEGGAARCLRFNEGIFQGYQSFHVHSADAYLLKQKGIALWGPEPASLPYETDWNTLIANMKENLNTYWRRWVRDCRRFGTYRFAGSFLSPRLIEWGVLGISRLYYTFREGDIISKAGAGEYALTTVPRKWHGIVGEALQLRQGRKPVDCFPAWRWRRNALNYIEYIIDKSNHLLDQTDETAGKGLVK